MTETSRGADRADRRAKRFLSPSPKYEIWLQLVRQEVTTAEAAAERIYTDKLSGSTKMDRPGLAALLDYARPGDTVVVAAIDRLGRSVAEVTRTITELGSESITLRALREGSTPPPPPAAPSPRSWPRWPSCNLSWAGNGVPHRANPGGRGVCRPLNRTNSALIANSSCIAWLLPVSLSENWPLPSVLGGQRHTDT